MAAKFPFYHQHDSMDCGPTCLRMIAKHYGKSYSLEELREASYIDREGVSLLGLSDAAESIGFRTLSVKASLDLIEEEAPLPFVAHWRQRHFVVVYKITKKHVFIADPAQGRIRLTREEFLNGWISDEEDGEKVGIALILEETPEFQEKDGRKREKKEGFRFLLSYLKPYRKLLIQLTLGFVIGSVLQLIFPFLTQSIVDYGINNQDVDFIYLILFGQIILFISQTVVNLVRSWILLHIGARINISLISDFLAKLMRLPISFFDTKFTGDIIQRINDHRRIEHFLTASSLNVLFSVFNLVIFGIILLYYSPLIFVVFLSGSVLYIFWVSIFLRKRRIIDYKQFDQLSANQSKILQLINGMQEIKLNNSEKQKRWEWERIQAKLYKISIHSLALEQWQQTGAVFISQLTNIMITFLAAKLVIDGQITLGMMLAVQYIIGQLNAPLNQLIDFMKTAQDAKLSLERLTEIHDRADEEDDALTQMTDLPNKRNIVFKDVTFQYGGPDSPLILDHVDLIIPEGKVTAIVGTSGSGKTTLLKLILKFYDPTSGRLTLNNTPLSKINNRKWRSVVGTVMQDGYIFSDTLARNVAVGVDKIDKERLVKAVRLANLEEFVEALPLGFNTKVGDEGNGLSQGQKQRLLIARAIYKNPEIMLFDEATNALDAHNEKIIMENLNAFYQNKTVVVVAHRLSTVKDADQIVVIEKGKIVELGKHEELTQKRGAYYNLVKNQLELGN